MGLYPCDCSICSKPFMWFSGGNPGQVCNDCMYGSGTGDGMKVIFLDFDGVLNSQGSFLYEHNRRERDAERSKQPGEKGISGPVNETLCNVCTANFQHVLEQYPEVKIVLSTTWRTMFDLDWLKAKLASYGIDSDRVIDKTPDLMFKGRGHEIQQWLDAHPEVTHYVAIDDNDDAISFIHGEDRFVHTTWEGGMDFNHARQLIHKLSNANKKKIADEKTRPEST